MHTHDCMHHGAEAQAYAERGSGCDYLEAVLADEKLRKGLAAGQESSMHRTMLACEGLAINFLYDHGRPASRVTLHFMQACTASLSCCVLKHLNLPAVLIGAHACR
jgi:hypothetical protein